MSSSLFRSNPPQTKSQLFRPQAANQRPASGIFGGKFGQIQDILKMLQSVDPKEYAMKLAQQNPEFAKFVEANKDKTVQQLMAEYADVFR